MPFFEDVLTGETMAKQDQPNPVVDQAIAEGGAYEVIRKRLDQQGATLQELAQQLNEQRIAEFGGSDMTVLAQTRVRTENNCIARDIVQVGDLLLFGYNVYIGLKQEVQINDVFALFSLQENDGEFELQPLPVEDSFLAHPSFASDFAELYRYYKHTRITQLSFKDGKLLAGFQIGERLDDVRVFRWSVSPDGKKVEYIDNRGERDLQLPPSYDFEWIETDRENYVNGRHPHVNVLDTVFVETINGDLTVKIEDNTDEGLGIYSEPVEDGTQSLDDASIFYAQVGDLLLLKILPYQETEWRYLVFNTLDESVVRIDAIGQSCVQLPEDHGIIFPGGYYLQSGEHKLFELDQPGLQFKRMIRSPNGEDVLYLFYDRDKGTFALLAYNVINKSLQNPIYAHGYALFGDGRLVIFSSEDEPTRVHPMQIWQTPYFAVEYVSQKQGDSQSWLAKIGNAELVRGISDFYALIRMINDSEVSMRRYEILGDTVQKVFDNYYWLRQSEVESIQAVLQEVSQTADLVVEEFAKVQAIQKQSVVAMREAEQSFQQVKDDINVRTWEVAEDFVGVINQMRQQKGHLITLRDYRYIDNERIEELLQALTEMEHQVSVQAAQFLSGEQALQPYAERIDALQGGVDSAKSGREIGETMEGIDETVASLDLLSELMATLPVEDANVHAGIIDSISSLYARLNQTRARARNAQQSIGSEEAVAQFGAQFKLLSQAVAGGLDQADTIEACDKHMGRLLVQLEELEGQFTDYDNFLDDILSKREEIYEAFETRKQQLLDQRQRRVQSVSQSADRILTSIEKRSRSIRDVDQLNTYFASDAMVLKVRDLVEQLEQLDQAVLAGDISARLKAEKDQALRALRDKTDIYEADGSVIKLGTHRFSVNTQEVDLALIPRNEQMVFHISGTDYYEAVVDQELIAMKPYWSMTMVSESDDVYRAEYLAYQVWHEAQQQGSDKLNELINDADALTETVREFATPRYREGYQKGVHDFDAALLLKQFVPAVNQAGLLRFDPLTRGFARFFWSDQVSGPESDLRKKWTQQARSAAHLKDQLQSDRALQILADDIAEYMHSYLADDDWNHQDCDVRRCAEYLALELSAKSLSLVQSKAATELVKTLQRRLDKQALSQLSEALESANSNPATRWSILLAWLEALAQNDDKLALKQRYIPEAVAILSSPDLSVDIVDVTLDLTVKGTLGDHNRLIDQSLSISVDEFLGRMAHHEQTVVPAFKRYQQLCSELTRQKRHQLGLSSFKARPLSSFVRNRLINECYLPLIGDNLAKQMGVVGDNKRTDLMGLLMMISPPGYGKTTLMEYVANRLGLIFMKINGPALGHDVKSLDPELAPNAAARQELEKINLAFEMGNNIMLYLDDIQHTHPEFLQKYISLCDGTRRIEGVWQGVSKTYDLRNKRFCVVMAGNPYTESGEMFKVPDMLANRADIYNLGDILGGMQEPFELSYIENSLTSNPVLAPLATRDLTDVYKLIDLANGINVPTTDLSHDYSAAELGEITSVLQKMARIREVILKVNQQYIASAAQADKYRVEPSFKLQGSYRNMNKMAEKISAVMNDDELQQLISDHYLGESQLLTSGSEENLLKLGEMLGALDEQQQQRWTQIKQDFLRNKALGGDEADVGNKVVAQLVDLVASIDKVNSALTDSQQANTGKPDQLPELVGAVNRLADNWQQQMGDEIQIVNQPVPGLDDLLRVIADSLQTSIMPLVVNMDKKLDIDTRNLEKINELTNSFKKLDARIKAVTEDDKPVQVLRKKRVVRKKAVGRKKKTRKSTPTES